MRILPLKNEDFATGRSARSPRWSAPAATRPAATRRRLRQRTVAQRSTLSQSTPQSGEYRQFLTAPRGPVTVVSKRLLATPTTPLHSTLMFLREIARGCGGSACIVMDGRLWQSVGPCDLSLQYNFCGPQFRACENHQLSIRPGVLTTLPEVVKAVVRAPSHLTTCTAAAETFPRRRGHSISSGVSERLLMFFSSWDSGRGTRTGVSSAMGMRASTRQRSRRVWRRCCLMRLRVGPRWRRCWRWRRSAPRR